MNSGTKPVDLSWTQTQHVHAPSVQLPALLPENRGPSALDSRCRMSLHQDPSLHSLYTFTFMGKCLAFNWPPSRFTMNQKHTQK